jgi:hypothetical protein
MVDRYRTKDLKEKIPTLENFVLNYEEHFAGLFLFRTIRYSDKHFHKRFKVVIRNDMKNNFRKSLSENEHTICIKSSRIKSKNVWNYFE